MMIKVVMVVVVVMMIMTIVFFFSFFFFVSLYGVCVRTLASVCVFSDYLHLSVCTNVDLCAFAHQKCIENEHINSHDNGDMMTAESVGVIFLHDKTNKQNKQANK